MKGNINCLKVASGVWRHTFCRVSRWTWHAHGDGGGALTLCFCHEMDAYLLQSKVVSIWKISAYQSWFFAKSLHRHMSKISGRFDSHVSIVHLQYANIFCIKMCVGLVEWKRKCGNVASQEAQPTLQPNHSCFEIVHA